MFNPTLKMKETILFFLIMVIILNGLLSRRIQEADSFPFLISPPFTSPLRMYLVQYLSQFILAH